MVDRRCVFHSEDTAKDQRPLVAYLTAAPTADRLECAGWVFPFFVELGRHVGEEVRSLPSADFRGATFAAGVSFMGAVFTGFADFDRAKFTRTGWFLDTTFESDANFARSSFEDEATFAGARFNGDVTFEKASFAQRTYFIRAHLRGRAYFTDTTFSGYAIFDGTEFEQDEGAEHRPEVWFARTMFAAQASFSATIFHVDTYFTETIFPHGVQFFATIFKKSARFHRVTFAEHVTLTQVDFGGDAEFVQSDLKNVLFQECQLAGVRLARAYGLAEAAFNFGHAARYIAPEEVLARQGAIGFSEAESVYREMRRGFEARKHYQQAHALNRRELEMRRLGLGARRPAWWGWLRANVFSMESMYRYLSNYGDSPWLPLVWLAGLILISPWVLAATHIDLGRGEYSLGQWSWDLKPYADLLAFSVRSAALIPDPAAADLNLGARLWQIVALRLAVPFMGVLFTLAVRRRFRR